MPKIDDALSRSLSTLMFIATILVVMCHVDDIIPNRGGSWLVAFLGGPFTNANVANFFFLTGFFLALHYGEQNWWGKALVKRIKTLIIPYILWCLIYFFIIKGGMTLTQILQGAPITQWAILDTLNQPAFGIPQIFGLGFLLPPIDFALWYIKTLFYFILVSPPFFYLLKRYGYYALAALGTGGLLFHIIGHHAHWSIMPLFKFGFNLTGFICFLAGAICAMKGSLPTSKTSYAKTAIALSIWTLSAVLYSQLHGFSFFLWGPINTIIEVAMLHLLVASIPYRVHPSWVKTAFFIYASHFLVLKFIAQGVPTLSCVLPPILLYLVLLFTTLGVCIGGAFLLARITPRFAALLSGGRSS